MDPRCLEAKIRLPAVNKSISPIAILHRESCVKPSCVCLSGCAVTLTDSSMSSGIASKRPRGLTCAAAVASGDDVVRRSRRGRPDENVCAARLVYCQLYNISHMVRRLTFQSLLRGDEETHTYVRCAIGALLAQSRRSGSTNVHKCPNATGSAYNYYYCCCCWHTELLLLCRPTSSPPEKRVYHRLGF